MSVRKSKRIETRSSSSTPVTPGRNLMSSESSGGYGNDDGNVGIHSFISDYQDKTFSEKLRLWWFFIDAFTHLTIELGYVLLALGSTAQKSDTFMGSVWRQYARADPRWEVSDPTVISIEIATVAMGVLCLFLLYGIWNQKTWTHPLQIVVCVSELYGGWMTFAPEWVSSSPTVLVTDDPILLWIYLVFMNGLWVVLPVVLLWESYTICSTALNRTSRTPSDCCCSPPTWVFHGCAILILLYIIIVPVVLGLAPFVEVH
jgi:hypothetical protein